MENVENRLAGSLLMSPSPLRRPVGQLLESSFSVKREGPHKVSGGKAVPNVSLRSRFAAEFKSPTKAARSSLGSMSPQGGVRSPLGEINANRQNAGDVAIDQPAAVVAATPSFATPVKQEPAMEEDVMMRDADGGAATSPNQESSVLPFSSAAAMEYAMWTNPARSGVAFGFGFLAILTWIYIDSGAIAFKPAIAVAYSGLGLLAINFFCNGELPRRHTCATTLATTLHPPYPRAAAKNMGGRPQTRKGWGKDRSQRTDTHSLSAVFVPNYKPKQLIGRAQIAAAFRGAEAFASACVPAANAAFAGVDAPTTLRVACALWALVAMNSVMTMPAVCMATFLGFFSLPFSYAAFQSDIQAAMRTGRALAVGAWDAVRLDRKHKVAAVVAAFAALWLFCGLHTKAISLFVALVALKGVLNPHEIARISDIAGPVSLEIQRKAVHESLRIRRLSHSVMKHMHTPTKLR